MRRYLQFFVRLVLGLKCALCLSCCGLGQTLQPIHYFSGYIYPPDGAGPQAALTQGWDGNMYGTTYEGGAYSDPAHGNYGAGTVFRITPDGRVTILVSFGDDGAHTGYPVGALVHAHDGNLYGACEVGGGSSLGTLFKVTTNGFLSIVYSFYDAGGTSPNGSLVEGPDGQLYGTCAGGGALRRRNHVQGPAGRGTADQFL